MNEENTAETPPAPNKKKHPNGLLVIALLVVAAFGLSYNPSVDAVFCDQTTLATKPDVIMLGASWCPFCSQARRYFVNNDINYCEYDVEDSAEGEQLFSRVRSQGIAQGVPVIFIGDHKISGFDEASVEKILMELDLL